MIGSPCRFVLSFCVLLFATSLAKAEEAPAGVPFGEVIDVRAVNVEAVVTSRGDKRVPGLTAESFGFLVDGKPVPIDFFLEVRQGEAVAASGEGVRPALPADVAEGEAVAHNYLVFIDELTSPIRARKEALRRLTGELGRLGPADRMAVVALGESGLTRLSPWSGSRTELEAALKTAAGRTGSIQVFEPSANLVIESAMMGGQMDRLQMEKLRFSAFEQMIAAAAETQQALADAPGRKVMLLITGRWTGGFYKFSMQEGLDRLRALTDASNRLGYTIYPVQLQTVADTIPGADRNDSADSDPLFRNHKISALQNEQLGLLFAADETGGKVLNLGQSYFTKAAEDLSSYYWLGFSSDGGDGGDGRDGQRRTVEVRVKGKGLKVRTRSTYLPLSRQAGK